VRAVVSNLTRAPHATSAAFLLVSNPTHIARMSAAWRHHGFEAHECNRVTDWFHFAKPLAKRYASARHPWRIAV
jgi:hypothetical protein